MVKERYDRAEVEVIRLTIKDVLTDSQNPDDEYEGEMP